MSNDTYRIGELVWYDNESVWRLGIIACNIGHYILWPLACASTVEIPFKQLRPFRSYTVPPMENPNLRGKDFDEIDWDAIHQLPNNDSLVIEASKLAAMRIHRSVSLVGVISHIRGCYLGAERIKIGDVLRFKRDRPSPKSIILVSAIVTTNSSLKFRGTIYEAAPNQTWTLAKEEAEVSQDQICGRIYEEFRGLNHWHGPAKLRATRWETLGKSVVQDDESKAILDRIELCDDEDFSHGNETPCTQLSQLGEAGKTMGEAIEHVSASDPLQIAEATTRWRSARTASQAKPLKEKARTATPRKRPSLGPATRSSLRLALRRSLLEAANSN